jgi:hypothetical protein
MTKEKIDPKALVTLTLDALLTDDPKGHATKQAMFKAYVRYATLHNHREVLGANTFFSALPFYFAFHHTEARHGRPYVDGKPGPAAYVGVRLRTDAEVEAHEAAEREPEPARKAWEEDDL